MLESNCWHTRPHCLYFSCRRNTNSMWVKQRKITRPRQEALNSSLAVISALQSDWLMCTFPAPLKKPWQYCAALVLALHPASMHDLSVRPHTRWTRRTRRTRLTFASLASFMSFISFISFISSTFASRQSEQTPRSFRTSLGLGKFRDVQLRLCKSLTRSPWSRARDRFDRCNRKLRKPRKPRKLQPRAQARAADFTELALWSTQHGPFCKAIFRSMRLIFSVHQDWNKLEQVWKNQINQQKL